MLHIIIIETIVKFLTILTFFQLLWNYLKTLALCMAEGIQIFKKESVVTFGHTRDEKRIAHLVMMGFGFVCLTIGISLRISATSDYNGTHFNTVHAQLGLATWIISFVSAVGGLVLYCFPTTFNPRVIKLLHIFLGISAFVIGIATLSLGIKHYLLPGFQRGWIALIILLVVYGSYCLISPLTSFFNYLISK